MANSVYIGMSAALASQRRLEVVSNNIANANTAGFKQQRVSFDQYLVETLDGSPAQKGFTAIGSSSVDMQSGALEQTGNPLDLALEGEGFFVLAAETGTLLSRAGNFRVAGNGQLVDSAGLPLMGGRAPGALQPISVRPDGGPVSVASDGSVEQDGTVLAQIAVVTTDVNALSSTGGTHLRPADPNALANVDDARVASGYLEASNVNPVRGMIDLIEIGHDYQTANKLMNETRKLDRRVMNSVR